MQDKLKVAIIGCGSISNAHINAYMANPRVELYAFCDIDESILKTQAKIYKVDKTFTDLNEMLKLDEIDAVSVCTSNAAHAKCSIAALNAGKHVLCEKPMAMNQDEAVLMKEAADRNHKLLMVGFVRRFGNDLAIVKDFVDNGYFGDIYYSKACYLRRHGSPGGWFGDKSLSGGGPLIDLGVHVIDFTRYVMGNPKPVSVYGATFEKLGNRNDVKSKVGYSSAGAKNHDVFNVEDLATALIRFDNGSVLSIEASFSLNTEKDKGCIEFFGTKAGAKLDPELKIYQNMNGYMANIDFATPTALSFDQLFETEINHFVSCLLDNAPCKSPAEDGVAIMSILDAIYESAKTGHEVIIK